MNKIHIRIGRAVDNQLVIENSGVDDYHLELFSDPDGNVFITDLNTMNGTYVNGRLLEGFTMLSPGDNVVLGQHHLFRWESYIQKKVTSSETKQVKKEVEVPVYMPIQNKKINKQLVVIYTLIVLVLLLIGFLID